MTSPTNFTNPGHRLSSSSSVPGPASVRVHGGGSPAPAKRTHLEEPTISINRKGRVLPSTELCRLLNLSDGSPIDLLPPASRNGLGPWHLDCRPTARGRLTHTVNSRPQFDCKHDLPEKAFCKNLGRGKYSAPYNRITLEIMVQGLEDFDFYTFKVVGYADPAPQ